MSFNLHNYNLHLQGLEEMSYLFKVMLLMIDSRLLTYG